jgi:hypothetical protein
VVTPQVAGLLLTKFGKAVNFITEMCVKFLTDYIYLLMWLLLKEVFAQAQVLGASTSQLNTEAIICHMMVGTVVLLLNQVCLSSSPSAQSRALRLFVTTAREGRRGRHV